MSQSNQTTLAAGDCCLEACSPLCVIRPHMLVSTWHICVITRMSPDTLLKRTLCPFNPLPPAFLCAVETKETYWRLDDVLGWLSKELHLIVNASFHQ